jgi:tRNA (mo5U34)-methyltransferase
MNLFRNTRQAVKQSLGMPPDDPVTWPEPARPRDQAALVQLAQSYSYWYQRIYLGRGIYTTDTIPLHSHIWKVLERMLPDDLNGACVLDVGCNAGFFCLQTKLRGAGRVVGVETLDLYLKQAADCRDAWGLDVEYLDLDASNLHTLGQRFSLVVFTGILYHLKNPLDVLEKVGNMCDDAIYVETEVLSPKHDNVVYARQGTMASPPVTACHSGMMKFIETTELCGDPTNWWIPDTECVRAMLRSVGFKHFSSPTYFGETRMALAASRHPESLLKLS